MNGTGKQIKWAGEIKAKIVPGLIQDAKAEIAECEQKIIDEQDPEYGDWTQDSDSVATVNCNKMNIELCRLIPAWLESVDDASWWIDNRNPNLNGAIKQLLRAGRVYDTPAPAGLVVEISTTGITTKIELNGIVTDGGRYRRP